MVVPIFSYKNWPYVYIRSWPKMLPINTKMKSTQRKFNGRLCKQSTGSGPMGNLANHIKHFDIKCTRTPVIYSPTRPTRNAKSFILHSCVKIMRGKMNFHFTGPRTIIGLPPISLTTYVLKHTRNLKAMETLVVPKQQSACFWPLIIKNNGTLNKFMLKSVEYVKPRHFFQFVLAQLAIQFVTMGCIQGLCFYIVLC